MLKHHQNAISKLVDNMLEEKADVNSAIKGFLEVGINDSQIRDFYPIYEIMKSHMENNEILWEEDNKEFDKVNYLLRLLMNDAVTEINSIFTDRKNIYNIIRSLHNLPRVYLGKEKHTLCELNQIEITQEEALKYAFQNMNETNTKKYKVIN